MRRHGAQRRLMRRQRQVQLGWEAVGRVGRDRVGVRGVSGPRWEFRRMSLWIRRIDPTRPSTSL